MRRRNRDPKSLSNLLKVTWLRWDEASPRLPHVTGPVCIAGESGIFFRGEEDQARCFSILQHSVSVSEMGLFTYGSLGVVTKMPGAQVFPSWQSLQGLGIHQGPHRRQLAHSDGATEEGLRRDCVQKQGRAGEPWGRSSMGSS